MSQQTIGWIIRYIGLVFFMLFALLNVVIIFAEKLHRKRDSIYHITFIIQLIYAIIIFNQLMYHLYSFNIIMSIVIAVLYYSLWFTSNLLTLVLLNFVIRILKDELMSKVYNLNNKLKYLCFAISFLIFIPNSLGYSNCKIGQYPFYFGICSTETIAQYIVFCFWLTGIIISFILAIYMMLKIVVIRNHLINMNQLSNQKQLYLKLVWIPFSNLILILLNLSLTLTDINATTGWKFYLAICLHNFQYLVTLLNLVFFIKFLRESNVNELRYFQRLLFRKIRESSIQIQNENLVENSKQEPFI